MYGRFRSEVLKLKNTWILPVHTGSFLLSVSIGFLICKSGGNIRISTKREVFASIFFMIQVMVTLLNGHLAFTAEKRCGQFQNIFSSANVRRIWVNKLSVMVLLQILTAFFSLFIIGTASEALFFLPAILTAAAVHILALTAVHMLILSLVGEIGNLLAGISEVILILFSTNLPMKNLWQYYPCIYGYKINEFWGSVTTDQWMTVTGAAAASIVLAVFASQYLKR
ncbi:MAG: hypothetical protein Q4A78_10725 [Peptostreptococcaceae bacterium]|nr:hypothetical protein [Peptostreptococcaceae bacterium]